MSVPTRQQLVESVGSVFEARTPEGATVALELTAVTTGRASAGFEQFSAHFRGPLERPLPQMTYSMEHARLGQLDLFIVPVGSEEAGLIYEAVFSTKLTS